MAGRDESHARARSEAGRAHRSERPPGVVETRSRRAGDRSRESEDGSRARRHVRPDPVAGCLRIDQTAKLGGGNHVKIPHGLFEWHTHPLGCGMKECSLASPSSTDVDVMLKDATTDNLAHFVFTSQGCFVVRLTPGLVARIRDGSQTDVARSIVKKFEALQEEFGVRYDATRTSKDRDAVERWHETRWRVLAKRVGLDAAFYRLPAQPVVTVVTSTGPAAA
eukprot:jgi/Mesvir1/9238/Mv24165-RA.1